MTAVGAGTVKQLNPRPHPHLYEINTWAWLEELSARLGRFVRLDDVPDAEWDALAQRGFDIVWLMGVWQRSAESRRIALATQENIALFDRALPGWKPADVVGSPYAVAQYFPDPRIGTWDSLDAAREKLHARGMALFLDFVGNHTALDHPWRREHPEFYVQGTEEDFRRDPASFFRSATPRGVFYIARGRDPYFPPWEDVAQLNHFSPQMRAAQLADLRNIASHCDGVRCDMAMLHLKDVFARVWGHLLPGVRPPEKEFWIDARAAAPDLILFAEVYWGMEERLLDLGFCFAYDKGLYDAVRVVNMGDVHARLAADRRFQSGLARFLENHDEERFATAFGKERLVSAATLMGTLPGMRFYHQGEIEGRRTYLPITLRVAAGEPPDPSTVAIFEKILSVTKGDVFHNGEWGVLTVVPVDDATTGSLAAYEWRSASSWKVIVVNLAGAAAQGRVLFGGRPLPANEYIFRDALDDAHYARAGDELRHMGLFVRRKAFQAHLFDVTPA